MNSQELPRLIRVSLGSAIVLGLQTGKLDAAPTTAYLMTYREGKCTANCAFCPQARESHGRADMLSRVSWPIFPTNNVFNRIEITAKDGRIKRVCIQALNYPKVFNDILAIVKTMHIFDVPISTSCQPLNIQNLRLLAEAGVERVGIPLDAATEELFDKVKGSSVGGAYRWETQFKLLQEAVKVFGKGKVSTHLIVGLGETEKEMVETIQTCVNMNVLPALFAFTPTIGTALELTPQPPLDQYRRVQVARHLIVNKMFNFTDMSFDEKGRIRDFGVDKQTLLRIVQTGKPFLTSGCPNCNRPYYNEKPRGPIYNFARNLSKEERLAVQKELDLKLEC